MCDYCGREFDRHESEMEFISWAEQNRLYEIDIDDFDGDFSWRLLYRTS